jgi:hypothetical protein
MVGRSSGGRRVKGIGGGAHESSCQRGATAAVPWWGGAVAAGGGRGLGEERERDWARRARAGIGGRRLGFPARWRQLIYPQTRKDDFAQSGSAGITATATAPAESPDCPAARSMTGGTGHSKKTERSDG